MDHVDALRREASRVTRRRMLLGTAGAIGAAAFLNVCGDDDDGGSGAAATTAAGAATSAAVTTVAGADTTTAASSGGGGGGGGGDLATQLGIEAASAGKGKTIDLGAVLALTGTGSYYGKTMTRGLDLGAKHIAELGGPTFNYVYLDHKSGDPAAGVQAMAELIAKGVQAKFASVRRRHRGDAQPDHREQGVHPRRRWRDGHLRPGQAVLLGHPGDHPQRHPPRRLPLVQGEVPGHRRRSA